MSFTEWAAESPFEDPTMTYGDLLAAAAVFGLSATAVASRRARPAATVALALLLSKLHRDSITIVHEGALAAAKRGGDRHEREALDRARADVALSNRVGRLEACFGGDPTAWLREAALEQGTMKLDRTRCACADAKTCARTRLPPELLCRLDLAAAEPIAPPRPAVDGLAGLDKLGAAVTAAGRAMQADGALDEAVRAGAGRPHDYATDERPCAFGVRYEQCFRCTRDAGGCTRLPLDPENSRTHGCGYDGHDGCTLEVCACRADLPEPGPNADNDSGASG